MGRRICNNIPVEGFATIYPFRGVETKDHNSPATLKRGPMFSRDGRAAQRRSRSSKTRDRDRPAQPKRGTAIVAILSMC